METGSSYIRKFVIATILKDDTHQSPDGILTMLMDLSIDRQQEITEWMLENRLKGFIQEKEDPASYLASDQDVQVLENGAGSRLLLFYRPDIDGHRLFAWALACDVDGREQILFATLFEAFDTSTPPETARRSAKKGLAALLYNIE